MHPTREVNRWARGELFAREWFAVEARNRKRRAGRPETAGARDEERGEMALSVTTSVKRT